MPRQTLKALRRAYAEELRIAGPVRGNPRVIDAFAKVPREKFLPPGPWTLHGTVSWRTLWAPAMPADPINAVSATKRSHSDTVDTASLDRIPITVARVERFSARLRCTCPSEGQRCGFSSLREDF